MRDTMMAIDGKQLSEAIAKAPTDRQSAAIDRARAVSRRQQALLAAAGDVELEMAWIVARVASGADNAVDNALRLAGLDSWIPVVAVETAWRGGRRKRASATFEKPVWPGYVFVRCAMNARSWAGLFTIDGVVALLGTASGPVAVRAEEVRRLRAMLSSDATVRDRAVFAVLPGDAVIVRDGPFASFEGVVFEVDGERGRVGVEVPIFGRMAPVALDLAQIRKLG